MHLLFYFWPILQMFSCQQQLHRYKLASTRSLLTFYFIACKRLKRKHEMWIVAFRKRVNIETVLLVRGKSRSGGPRRVTASVAMYRRSVGSGMRKYRSQCYTRGCSMCDGVVFAGKYTCTRFLQYENSENKGGHFSGNGSKYIAKNKNGQPKTLFSKLGKIHNTV